MKKLTKTQVIARAKQNPDDGVLIELYPSKCGPANTTWVQGYPVRVYYKDGQAVYMSDSWGYQLFNELLTYFETYNCNSELGKTIHYYLTEEETK